MKTYTFNSTAKMPACFARTITIAALNIEQAVDYLIQKNSGMFVASYVSSVK
jgi:hypothetical protein